MRYLLLLLSAVMLFSAPASAAPPLPKARLLAVYFYADWCPNCKLLSPKIEAARAEGKFDEGDVLFVTMNLTDKPHIRQSILLAQALGIGDFLKAQGSATGYLAVLDATTKKEITRFDNRHDAKAIAAGLRTPAK